MELARETLGLKPVRIVNRKMASIEEVEKSIECELIALPICDQERKRGLSGRIFKGNSDRYSDAIK